MELKLIHFPTDYLNILFLSGRNCYGLEEVKEDVSIDQKKEFINKLIKNNHLSVLEHINISVYSLDMSRSFMSQITRHRLVSYSIKSQHYCVHTNFRYKPLESSINATEYIRLMEQINQFYKNAIAAGMPKYIAREVLPNSTLTNIFMTTNVREWRTIIIQRITKNNTPEIQVWAETILLLFNSKMPELFQDLVDHYVKF